MACASEAAVPAKSDELSDGCGRVVDHLRMSVTDRCDLRCQYCRPSANRPPDLALTDDERLALVRFLASSCGLRQVRFTGGEPLVYPGLVDLISATRRIAPQLTIALTTNGQRLAKLAGQLRDAGLDRINVSVDSLDTETYCELTGGRLDRVLAGLKTATLAGFRGIRINCVAIRGVNEREFAAMVRWAVEQGFEMRFLEAMPIGPAGELNRERFVSAAEIRQVLGREYRMADCGRPAGSTSHRYRLEIEGRTVEIGIIAPVSEPFCTDCRRMRITADGRLFPCLLDSRSFDLKPVLRAHAPPERLREALVAAVRGKAPSGSRQPTGMVQLGG